MDIKITLNEKLKIKPVLVKMIHQNGDNGKYSGPCRPNGKNTDTEFDRKAAIESFVVFSEEISDRIGLLDEVELMEPCLMTYHDDWNIPSREYDKLKSEIYDADAVLIYGDMVAAIEIAIKYNKPILAYDCCFSTTIVNHLRHLGKEAYGFIDLDGLISFIPLLRARKGITETRVLTAVKGNPGTVTSTEPLWVKDYEAARKKFGVKFNFIDTMELLDSVDKLSLEALKEAEEITKDLIKHADYCTMSEDLVLRSVKFNVATRSALAHFDCNAFTMPCQQICSTARLYKEKYLFCLNHSLLKEAGIPTACETDWGALLALIFVMNLTNRAPHMGNLHPVTNAQGTMLGKVPEDIENTENLIEIMHAVSTRYMKGRAGQPQPYGIRSFTTDGWGAVMQCDYTPDIGP